MKDNSEDIELRSEEVQEVMNKVPPSILRYGIGTLVSIVMLLFIGCFFFHYPETVEAELTLTTKNPPIYIKSTMNGKIERLYVINGETVKRGDILAVLENVANTEDMLRLRQSISYWSTSGARIEKLDMIFFNQLPMLGSVQSSYSSCLLSWHNYLLNGDKNRIYKTELISAFTSLLTSLAEWEKSYLLVSPINGQIAFMQLWENQQYVTAEETMFVIVPTEKITYKGNALLPMSGIGKVKIGQEAIIRITGFSEEEFAPIRGEVASISPVPNEDGNYIVEICFPASLSPEKNIDLSKIKVLKGRAEIIIRDSNILERLFSK